MRRSLCLFLFAGVAVCPLMRAQAGEAVPSSALTGDLSRIGERSSATAAAPVPLPKPPFPVDAHVDAYAKFGSDRRLTGTEAFLPLSWDGQILSFADLRFVADDADGREVNAGLGLRRVSDDGSFILGGYGFLDRRRSPTGKLYTQATAGAEVLTESWDVRANAYAPLSEEKAFSETTLPASLSLSGTGILATGGTATATETPLFGADFEVGYKLGVLEDTWFDDTRVYGGAYHFDAKNTDAMTGTRFRVETAPFEWLRFGAEGQRDNIRGETGFVEARIRVPLDFWRGVRHGPARPEGILKRLDTRIARDVDVVTQTGTVTDTRSETVLNAATGTAQKVYVVDNTADPGGDGSAENPFNTLAAAQGAASAHGIVYVKRGDGTSAGMNAGITLASAGQKLIGSGVDLTFDADTMRAPGIPGLSDGATVVAAAVSPVITNAAGNGVTITGDSVEVAGITVSGASDNGIYAYNADDVTIRDVTASGSTNDGIKVEASGAGVSVTGVSVEDVTAVGNRNGIRLYAQTDASLAAKVEGSAATGNAQHGIIVYDDSTAGSVDADLGGGSQGGAGLNAITGNTLEDLALDTDGAAVSAQSNWWGQAGGPATTDLYEGAPIDTGLVGHWMFDDGAGGIATDRSGNGNDGTLTNGPTWTTGQLNGALSFDGVNDVVSVPHNASIDLPDILTVSVWIKGNAVLDNYSSIVQKGAFAGQKGYSVQILDFGPTTFVRVDTNTFNQNLGANSFPNVITNTWRHLVAILDNGMHNAYTDAILTRSTAYLHTGGLSNTLALSIGRRIYDNTNAFNGLIDDVRIYNRALSAPEIAELYRMDATGTVTATGALAAPP